MHTGKGHIAELVLADGRSYVRLACPPQLIPTPGQFLLASDASDSPLPLPLFYTDSAPQGFIAAAPAPVVWSPGSTINLRGPLGRGFSLPPAARKIALVAFDGSAARLKGLIRPALRQGAAVVLVSDFAPEDLPDDVEVQPLPVLEDVLDWADYLALDASRENLSALRERLGKLNPMAGTETQVLIRTAIPCGGIAECGVCAVTMKSEWRLACKEGPVFDWRDL